MFLRYSNVFKEGSVTVQRTLAREESDPVTIANLKRKGWEEFTPDPPTAESLVPTEAPAYALRAALKLDKNLGKANTAIAELPEPRRTVAEEKFSGNTIIRRSSKLIKHLAESIPLSPLQLDSLFTVAGKIADDTFGD